MSALAELENQGFSLKVRAGKLVLSPRSRLTPELVNFARQHKPEILRELTTKRPDFDDLPKDLKTCHRCNCTGCRWCEQTGYLEIYHA